jgi:hypothetical protein
MEHDPSPPCRYGKSKTGEFVFCSACVVPQATSDDPAELYIEYDPNHVLDENGEPLREMIGKEHLRYLRRASPDPKDQSWLTELKQGDELEFDYDPEGMMLAAWWPVKFSTKQMKTKLLM